MPNRLNKLMLEEMKAKFAEIETCVFLDFTGLSGRQAAALRRQLRARCGEGAELSVVKTSLARRALAAHEDISPGVTEELAKILDGPTAMAYGADDPATLAKVIAEWAKKNDLMKLKGGMLDGRPLAAEAAGKLAELPTRQVLLGQAVGVGVAPLRAALGVASGMIRQVLTLADALAKKKEETE